MSKYFDLLHDTKYYDYSVKSTNPRHARMSVDEELYDTPHNEDEVGRRPMKIQIVGRIVEARSTKQSVGIIVRGF